MFPYIYIALPSYMVMAFVGGFSALMFLYFRIRTFGILFNDFLKLFLAAAIGCLAGAKALFFLTILPQIPAEYSLLDLPILLLMSGYVFYGGLFGSLIALKMILRRMPSYTWSSLRIFIAPAIPLFHGFGRIGCFMAGCCYGLPLADPIQLGPILLDYLPTQIIEAGFEFLLFGILVYVGYRWKQVNLLKLYLTVYAIFRFIIEFYRGDLDRGFWIVFSTSQWISIFILGYYVFEVVKRKYKC